MVTHDCMRSVGIENSIVSSVYRAGVPFEPGHADASQGWSDADSSGILEPKTDSSRNHLSGGYDDLPGSPERRMVDRAKLLNPSVSK